MKIAIIGAGAVGAWYGARLALAGHEVHFLLRSDYEEVRRDGYRLRSKSGEERLFPVSAHRRPEDIGRCDLVVIALKATANGGFAGMLTPLVGPETTLLTLQNGMGNAEALGELFGIQKVMAGLCFVCINRTAPGVIENYHAGKIAFAEGAGPATDRTRSVAGAFERAGVTVSVSDSLEEILWKKLCWNVPFNGLAIAAGGLTTDLIMANPDLVRRARLLMEELRAAARARGIGISDKFIESQFTLTAQMGPYKPSSLIDWQAGRPVEIEAIWGVPLRRGLSAGVPMPELTRLHAELAAACANRH